MSGSESRCASIDDLTPECDLRPPPFLRFAFCFFVAISGVRRNLHDVLSCRWPDAPVPPRVLRPNKSAVVAEDHSAVGVSHVQRERGGILEVRQMRSCVAARCPATL